MTVKWLHVLASTLLFGTGIGSAFYLLLSTLTRNVQAIAVVSRIVVIADWLFTATTAIAQPLTGFWLIHLAGFPLSTPWLLWSIVLYVIAIACWLPVVALQIRLRDLAQQAARDRTELPARYWRCFKMWVALGFPAFFAFVAIFYLMVAKPALV
ncbi:DUF2269 family protein [Parapusillimonas sp. JC17]|uniref:DUF2269 family protein n=1 Tax=Parapusillimonas sp. JC17 TaxID=3445768 RepID=UPI003F9F5D42